VDIQLIVVMMTNSK